MRNGEPGQPQDDLNVEITSLDDGTPAAFAPAAVRLFARRHKRPLAIATVGMVALAFLLIVVSTSAVRDLAIKILAIPTPAPTQVLYAGEDLFYVQADPIWGHLTVDGRAIAHLPVVGVNAPLHLTRGQHELVWSAEPFQQQRCILSVPTSYLTDTCADHSTVRVGSDIDSIVIFTESLTTLPDNQRLALTRTVQEALATRQSTVIVQKGELYALSTPTGVCYSNSQSHCYAVASQPLFATLHFRLDTNAASNETCLTPEPGCTYLRGNCFTFCTVGANPPGVANIWNILAPVLPIWTFQTPDGAIVERDVPDNIFWDLSTGELADESLISMQITWQHSAWQVTLPETLSTTSPIGLNPVCEAAQNVVGIQYPPTDSFGEPLFLQWQYASGLVPASGCLGAGLSRIDSGSANSASNTSP